LGGPAAGALSGETGILLILCLIARIDHYDEEVPMFGSQILDVVAGMVFIYLLLSIICTAANEMIASLFSLRGRNLAKGIANLLADKRIKCLDELFYDHPLIKSLYRGKRKPSYIPGHTFALAFLDGIAPFEGKIEKPILQIREAVSELKDDSELKRTLSIFLNQAGDDFAKLQTSIETWFNDSMTRAAGWYKRKSQFITIILAVLLVGVTNADTLTIVKKLYNDPVLRAAVVAQAQEFAKQQPGVEAANPETKPEPTPSGSSEDQGNFALAEPTTPVAGNAKETFTQTFATLQQLGIPLGWEFTPKEEEWVNKVIGLLLTALAISLGAPFWFDILNRITKIRSTGLTPEATAKEENIEKAA
jgi:hypothetical protein